MNTEKKFMTYICTAFALLLLFAAILPISAAAEPAYDRIAPENEQAATNRVGKYGMLPIYGRDVKDGVYSVAAESSSPMFHIIDCRLTVKDGEMTADITLNGQGYLVLYAGTAEDAAKADKNDYIGFTENKEGKYVYTFPVDALDKALDCAAFSKNKEQWYDRKLLFEAASLPKDALLLELPDYDAIEAAMNGQADTDTAGAGNATAETAENNADSSDVHTEDPNGTNDAAISQTPDSSAAAEPMTLDREDGEYSIEVELFGGSGKAAVVSPTILKVENGRAYARIQWSSANYDYMIVDGKKYQNLAADGAHSEFEIPVAAMDTEFSVIADTTAMGAPREIEYALVFYGDTIGSKSQMPQEAAKRVVAVAIVIIVGGGILNHFTNKRKRG